MKWYNSKIDWKAAAWAALIMISVRIVFQIRRGEWYEVGILLVLDILLLAIVLKGKRKISN